MKQLTNPDAEIIRFDAADIISMSVDIETQEINVPGEQA